MAMPGRAGIAKVYQTCSLVIVKFEPGLRFSRLNKLTSHLSHYPPYSRHNSNLSSNYSHSRELTPRASAPVDHMNNLRFMHRWKSSFPVTFVCTALALIMGLCLDEVMKLFEVEAAIPFKDYDDDIKTNGGSGSPNASKPTSRRFGHNFVADVVEAVGDCIVCIKIKDNRMVDWITGKPDLISNGSGFIIKEDGLILTNAHVVAGTGPASISVKLGDGRTFSAQVEDIDLNADLAILRINARGLRVMSLGSSADTRIGEWVVALGSPLSLRNTATVGVVSSVTRKANELGITSNDISYIQTDATITVFPQFGNSGGPLVNLDGEAIGVNSMKLSTGISFAIPIDYVKQYLSEAEKRRLSGQTKTKKKHRYVGVALITLTEELIRQLLATSTLVPAVSHGVLVSKIVVGSPAYRCGLKPGDIIYRVNGKNVTSASEIFEKMKHADCVELDIIQSGTNGTSTCRLYPEECSSDAC